MLQTVYLHTRLIIVRGVSGVGGQEDTSECPTTRLVELTPMFSASQPSELNGCGQLYTAVTAG